jgi:hypothetical protein
MYFSQANNAETAAALGVLLDAAVNANYPGGRAKHPATKRDYFPTFLVSIPGTELFEVFLDAGDALVTDNSNQRRVNRLMEKIAERLIRPQPF